MATATYRIPPRRIRCLIGKQPLFERHMRAIPHHRLISLIQVHGFILANMAFVQRALLPLSLIVLMPVALSQQPVTIQRDIAQNGMPSSGGYKAPALSLVEMLESDHVLNEALMTFMRTGDSTRFRGSIFQAAQKGDVGAELLLAEQYIPERCPSEPNQDVPHCGKNENEPPHVIFQTNPLGIAASYEKAGQWLEKASVQGSGEASEVLAQLITRMQSNGHVTNHTTSDSNRLHALARSQGFDVEPISVTCFKLISGGEGVTLGASLGAGLGESPHAPFTPDELASLGRAGLSGSLVRQGEMRNGDSVLLMRPEGPVVRIRIILDHDPGTEVLLPMPAHHDVIYAQRGNQFLAFPGPGNVLPRFVSIMSLKGPDSQVGVNVQTMSGGYTGGFCGRFP